MSNEDDSIYNLVVTVRVKIKKWRINDQSIKDNQKWALRVYDENLEKWVGTATIDRPGEAAWVDSVVETKDP